MVPVSVSWSTVTGLPVAFARADADSVALNRRAAECGFRSWWDAACGDPVGAAWAGTVADREAAARAATTPAATGLAAGRLDMDMRVRKADMQSGILR
jgi:hypothetical protein